MRALVLEKILKLIGLIKVLNRGMGPAGVKKKKSRR
jgi:hypothetical protein